MTMVREQAYIEKVREGLDACENARMSGYKLDRSRSMPEPLRFQVHKPRLLNQLPFSTNLQMVLDTDREVFRRTAYD